jgi:hypothetical protein
MNSAHFTPGRRLAQSPCQFWPLPYEIPAPAAKLMKLQHESIKGNAVYAVLDI